MLKILTLASNNRLKTGVKSSFTNCAGWMLQFTQIAPAKSKEGNEKPPPTVRAPVLGPTLKSPLVIECCEITHPFGFTEINYQGAILPDVVVIVGIVAGR